MTRWKPHPLKVTWIIYHLHKRHTCQYLWPISYDRGSPMVLVKPTKDTSFVLLACDKRAYWQIARCNILVNVINHVYMIEWLPPLFNRRADFRSSFDHFKSCHQTVELLKQQTLFNCIKHANTSKNVVACQEHKTQFQMVEMNFWYLDRFEVFVSVSHWNI